MKDDSVKFIKPVYYDDFVCLGSACSYTCCQEWTIALSRREHKNIKATLCCAREERKGKRVLQRMRRAGSEREYSSILFNEKGVCPFLSEAGLCSVQLELGSQALPLVCRSFPRYLSVLGTGMVCGLSLGCEAVIEKMFQYPKGILFREERAAGLQELEIPGSTFVLDGGETRPLLRHALALQLLGVRILQDRTLSLEDRMLLLGWNLLKVDQWERDSAPEELQTLLRSLAASPDDDLKRSFERLQKNRDLQALNAANLLALFFQGAPTLKDFLERIQDRLGLETQMDKKGTIGEITCTFDREKLNAAEEGLSRFLSSREYIMENIAVSWFMQMRLPFYFDQDSIWDNYLLFAAMFHLLKYMVMGSLDEAGKQEDFVHAAVVCSRAMTHNPTRLAEIVRYLKWNGADTLAHVAILLK